MYRLIMVANKHADYQRIVWRDNTNEDCKSYKLLTVTFGTAPPPYVAVRTLVQVANDEGQEYPIAAEIVKNLFYMDDLLTGAADVARAVTVHDEVSNLLKMAVF